MTTDVQQRIYGRPFQPGQSGNVNGRPVGARTAFSNAFLTDLRDVWGEYGKDCMIHCAQKSKETFFAIASKLIPKDVQLTLEQTYPGGLDPVDIAILKAIRESVPDADLKSPQEVLSYVRDTLRAASATTIEASSDKQTDGIGSD